MRKLACLAVALGVIACAKPDDRAASAVIAYTTAASGIDAYARSPGAKPATLAAMRACDNLAYAGVEPVKNALIAGKPMTEASISGAEAAVPMLQSCLKSVGVR